MSKNNASRNVMHQKLKYSQYKIIQKAMERIKLEIIRE